MSYNIIDDVKNTHLDVIPDEYFFYYPGPTYTSSASNTPPITSKIVIANTNEARLYVRIEELEDYIKNSRRLKFHYHNYYITDANVGSAKSYAISVGNASNFNLKDVSCGINLIYMVWDHSTNTSYKESLYSLYSTDETPIGYQTYLKQELQPYFPGIGGNDKEVIFTDENTVAESFYVIDCIMEFTVEDPVTTTSATPTMLTNKIANNSYNSIEPLY